MSEKLMRYENLKRELTAAVQEYYRRGTPINDIRAALFAAHLMAERFGAIEPMAVAEEREKCAVIAENFSTADGYEIAHSIRARSNV